MKKIMITMMYSCFIWVGVANTLVADDPSDSFDIMYVYTSAAKEKAGGRYAIESQIHTSIDWINQSFINSQMNIRVNLVHMEEVYYPLDYNGIDDSNAFYTAYSHLIDRNDGYMDNVHGLRDKYSADFVQLVIANKAIGGLAGVTTLNNESAFSVIKQANMKYYAVHEIGHNFGINHGTGSGTYSYSNGYSNGSIRTIHGDNPGSLINYWSSPLVSYNGMLTGSNDKDARRTILENAYRLANFRKRPITTAPTLSTTPPIETFENSTTLELNGEARYEVYVNGVYKGVLDSNGKKTITLNLDAVYNDFSITLKHEPSGTESNALTFSIIKKVDTDGDGIYDHIEENLGLNPNNIDSDGDGYSDLEEVGDINNPTDTDNDGIIDALDEDSDNDGISDKDERLSTIVVTTVIVPYILYRN